MVSSPKVSLLGLLAFVAAAPQAPADLLGHWPFDQNTEPSALSETRVAWNLSESAKVISPAWIGKGGLDLSKTNSAELPQPNPPLEAFAGGHPRSVSLWIRLNQPQLPAKSKAPLFSTGLPTVGKRWEVRFDFVKVPALMVANEGDSRLYPLPSGPLNTWHHLLVSQAGDRFDSLLVCWDGAALKTISENKTARDISTASTPLLLGKSVKDATDLDKRGLDGLLDDLGLWGTGLTEADAALIHGLGRASDLGLLWWEDARRLAASPVGSQFSLNGQKWEKVSGLEGPRGAVLAPQRAKPGAAFVTDPAKGEGLRLVSDR